MAGNDPAAGDIHPRQALDGGQGDRGDLKSGPGYEVQKGGIDPAPRGSAVPVVYGLVLGI